MSANPSTTKTPNVCNLYQRPFSRPFLLTTSLNVEGLSVNKEILLADLCNRHDCDVLVLQETHRGPTRQRPKVNGMKLVLERPHDQYGSAIFVKPELSIRTAEMTCTNDIEILTIELKSCTVTSIYKPPGTDFGFHEPVNFNNQKAKLIIGDFNCHNTMWGYAETDQDGVELEKWAEQRELKLVHDPKLPPSFNSGRWRRGYNPDNIFVSEIIAQQTTKRVEDPIPRTQHRPISCRITPVICPEIVPFKRRFNFKKANWNLFTRDLDREIIKVKPEVRSYETFVNLIKKISRRHIPRGCRTNYIAGLSDNSQETLINYQRLFEEDPFSEETIEVGEELLHALTESRRERWSKLVGELDMKQNSRRAWSLIKNLSNDPTSPPTNHSNVTPDQIAHQLLLNGKTKGKTEKNIIQRDLHNESNSLSQPFALPELQTAISQMKANKAAGIDDLRVEQIQHFGPEANRWLLEFMNVCITTTQIPKMWRKARVVALLKPGKEPNDAKNYRPISLLCHLYKVLERLVLNRTSYMMDELLIPEQAGFRPGRSCCGQILNLTQHIEDGFERKQITAAAFVDLSAAYDTINHQKLVFKIYETTKDFGLTTFIKNILQNRRYFVTLYNKRSRWRSQKNGLAQGSVLAPFLYNIYTNDQPNNPEVKRFIYADDTAIAAQGHTFEEVERKLTNYLEELGDYYDQNHLKPNPNKTQVCAYHLRNKDAKRKLKITWREQQLEHCENPTYLGVKLDRTLSFRVHCQNTKQKVSARNNIIRKLTSTRWGAQPSLLRTSAMALCFSAAEYAAPVWNNSVHAKKVDIAINETGRILTGCLRPTPSEKIYPIMGIAPPSVRREVASEVERKKQITDPRHPLFHHQQQQTRLRSRKSFIQTTEPTDDTPTQRRLELWKQKVPDPLIKLEEKISAGSQLPYPIWKTLNRLRTGVTRCKTNLVKWGYEEGEDCECGQRQDLEHLLVCSNMTSTCTFEDILCANDEAIQVADYWKYCI